MRRLAPWLLAPALSCSSPVATVPVPAAAPPKPEPPPRARDIIVLAREDGLFELDTSGVVRRRISSVRGSIAPRFVPNTNDLVFLTRAGAGPDSPIAALHRLRLDTGASDVIAFLAPTTYADERPLRAEAESDVTIDQSGERLCINLFDRNVNMASCWIHFEVDLNRRRVKPTAVHWDTVRCGPAPTPVATPNHCVDPVSPRPAKTEWPHSVRMIDDISTLFLFKGKVKVRPLGDFVVAATSPSGRWEALKGHREEGDYIHFHAVLFDRASGEFYPLGKEVWPAPIEAKELAGPADALSDRAGDVVGETPLRWIGPDALVLGKALYLPAARRRVALDGDIAF
jgi:hypothetical protein